MSDSAELRAEHAAMRSERDKFISQLQAREFLRAQPMPGMREKR